MKRVRSGPARPPIRGNRHQEQSTAEAVTVDEFRRDAAHILKGSSSITLFGHAKLWDLSAELAGSQYGCDFRQRYIFAPRSHNLREQFVQTLRRKMLLIFQKRGLSATTTRGNFCFVTRPGVTGISL
jgi:hypothetical protein